MAPSVVLASGQANAEVCEDIAPTLTLLHEAPMVVPALPASGAGVARRLLPRECERLMGAEDNWTLVPGPKGKPLSDSARYRICGNGEVVTVAHWYGWRLARALEVA